MVDGRREPIARQTLDIFTLADHQDRQRRRDGDPWHVPRTGWQTGRVGRVAGEGSTPGRGPVRFAIGVTGTLTGSLPTWQPKG